MNNLNELIPERINDPFSLFEGNEQRFISTRSSSIVDSLRNWSDQIWKAFFFIVPHFHRFPSIFRSVLFCYSSIMSFDTENRSIMTRVNRYEKGIIFTKEKWDKCLVFIELKVEFVKIVFLFASECCLSTIETEIEDRRTESHQIVTS